MNSEFQDVKAPILDDMVQEREVRVFPYEMPNAAEVEAFIQGNSTSLVYIKNVVDINVTNQALNDETGYAHLEKDEDSGKFYFKILPSTSSSATLDITSATSVYGQNLSEELTIEAISNWYYEGELENIKLGAEKLIPAIFTIGKPFDRAEYEAGKQSVYISTPTIEAKEYDDNLNVIDKEGYYQMNFVNIKAIESQFTNARVLFTEHFDPTSDTFLTFDGNQNGITLGFENQTLINFIKGRGNVEEFGTSGSDEGTELGDVDFITKQPMAPFKMTPVDVQDKVSMYADWFDYDAVLPYVYAEKFKSIGPKSGGTLADIITVDSDMKLVQDMLVISAGFYSSWKSAPVLDSGGDAGKIDPKFRVGHAGYKAQTLAAKEPYKVVDTVFDNYVAEHPDFIADPQRYQPVKEVLAALSKYIISSYAVGKGNNTYNQVYLPWFLEPVDKLDFSEKISISSPDKGHENDQVDTWVLPDATLFRIKTTYFTDEYSSDKISKAGSELLLPKAVNLSGIKMVQTDRKLAIPEIGDTVSALTKLPLPGDINTKSSQDLMYIWYLPIEDQQVFEEFYLNTLSSHSTSVAGQNYKVQLKQGADGVAYTQASADQAVLKQQPGQILVAPTLTLNWKKLPDLIHRHADFHTGNFDEYLMYKDQKFHVRNDFPDWDPLLTYFRSIYRDVTNVAGVVHEPNKTDVYGMIKTVEHSGSNQDDSYYDVYVGYYTFTEATVLSSGGIVDTYSIEDRQVLFDKQQWKRFLTRFNIVPDQVIDYELLEKDDFQIKKLNELIIGSVWGNFVEIKSNNTIVAKIPLFNKDDETIGIQRILFI